MGPFTFVTAHLVAAGKYGYAPLDWFMLARDGKVIADDSTKVAFGKSGSQTDEHTGKPVPDQISFDYRDGDTRYVLTYARQKTLVSQKVSDYTSGLQVSETDSRGDQVPTQIPALLRARQPGPLSG